MYLIAGVFEAMIDLGTEVGLSAQISEMGRGGVFGIISMFTNAMFVLGSYLAGFLWEKYGGNVTMGFGGVIRIMAGIIFCITYSRKKCNISQKNERLCKVRNT